MTRSVFQKFCADRQQAKQFRTLQETRILPDGMAERHGQSFINFASNDYLGLSQHPALIERARDYAAQYGAGSTASRLITGSMPGVAVAEAALAAGKGCDSALIMGSGYQTNLTILAALADTDVHGRPVTVIADRLSHHSLLQGAMLGKSRLTRFHHNNYDHLEQILVQQAAQQHQSIIVTESVFGMDGDCADLPTLIELARRYEALLYVDEAHATGVFGHNGFGMAADYPGQIDVVMGTFGKALGGFGSYVTCDTVLRDYFVQRSGGLVYSTGVPPSVVGAMLAAIDLLPSLRAKRDKLLQNAAMLRQTLIEQGWDCGHSQSQIIPVMVGDEQDTLDLAEMLRGHGMMVAAIRPPTVPRGSSRLRISLSAAHCTADIQRLIDALGEAARQRTTHAKTG